MRIIELDLNRIGTPETWTTVAVMFRSLRPSVRLKRVALFGYISLSTEVVLNSLELLDDVFEYCVFSTLRVVTFQFQYDVDSAIDGSTIGKEVLQILESKLPKLFARKRIDIRVRVSEMGHKNRSAQVFDYSSHKFRH